MTSANTEGGQTIYVLMCFYYVKKKFGQGGSWPNAPPPLNTPLVSWLIYNT